MSDALKAWLLSGSLGESIVECYVYQTIGRIPSQNGKLKAKNPGTSREEHLKGNTEHIKQNTILKGDLPFQVWVKSAHWFQRRLKCFRPIRNLDCHPRWTTHTINTILKMANSYHPRWPTSTKTSDMGRQKRQWSSPIPHMDIVNTFYFMNPTWNVNPIIIKVG